MKNNIPKCINRIATELNNLKDIDNTSVLDIVTSANLSEKELSRYENYNHSKRESYGRNLILDTGKFKIFLMSWRVGDFTAIHNHGNTDWGCVHFFGIATHRLYNFENNQLKLIQKDFFVPEQNASVCGDLIHLMGNSGKRNFTTLHIYGYNKPENRDAINADVYIPEKKKVVQTTGTAYLDMKDDLIIEDKEFTSIDINTAIDYLGLIKTFFNRNNQTDVLERIDQILINPELYYQQN